MDIKILQLLFAIGLFIILVYMIGKIMVRPVRIIFRVGYSLLFGLLLIWGFNYLGNFIGIHIPANILTVLTSGFLGLPGLGLLVILQMIAI
ncbi:MAG: inhibitor of the pro-sigma processing machinery [Clostridia bacterium]|jgi:inhibitor of the pro-sigma K processing machinery|nr:SigmaK-factor processing regulatory BofA [Clostridiales bacterium]MDK2985784.1 inhibitor of the pro-sigma processing machinery [Clostridia bacterium]